MKFGEYLKMIRNNNKLSLRDVERACNISNPYLCQIEKGNRSIPTLKYIIKLANVYNVKIDKLVEIAIKEIMNKKNKEVHYANIKKA